MVIPTAARVDVGKIILTIVVILIIVVAGQDTMKHILLLLVDSGTLWVMIIHAKDVH
jgi:hypothetical protein